MTISRLVVSGRCLARARGQPVPLYVLVIADDEPLSINAHGDDGAEFLARSCLTGATPAEARVRLTTEREGRVLVDSRAGEMLLSV